MLRESSVPYSSLPQEEVGETYVSTRSTGEAHNRHSKSRLACIILVLLLIFGVPLMIIAPLAISRGSGRSDTSISQSINWAINHVGGQGKDDGISVKNNSASFINKATPTPKVVAPDPVVENTTLKHSTIAPQITTTTTTTTTPTTTTTTTTPTTTTTTTPPTTTTTTTTVPITIKPVVIIPTDSVLKLTVELPAGESWENQSGAASEPTVMPKPKEAVESSDGGDPGSSGGDGDGYYTPGQDISSLVNNFMSEHEWWMVVGLAVTAALTIALVIGTVAWIIQNRLASRRRRTNLQKVITDLQSRDKVVLLNSEDSEDEA